MGRVCFLYPVLLLAMLLWGMSSVASAQLAVVYPAQEGTTDVRYNDLIEILQTALEKTRRECGNFTLLPAAKEMNEARQIASLQQRRIINVMWTSTSTEKEKALLPVRIPLRMGLLGYRIGLISRENQQRFRFVQTLNDLRTVRVGQGVGWGDVGVYEAAGIEVVAAGYESLFPMVEKKRLDIFPRGITEVFNEYEANRVKFPEITVEQHLLFYYPWPYYFFVHKKDVELAGRIEKGLRIMQKDGSFKAIFDKYNAEAIARSNLANRKVIRLENPLLPAATPLDDKSLWFFPDFKP